MKNIQITPEFGQNWFCFVWLSELLQFEKEKTISCVFPAGASFPFLVG